jgi:sialic acid synthase SpsE
MIRDVQAALGRPVLEPSAKDQSERRKWFRHLVANRDIPSGTTLTAEMLEGKRPEQGISPEHLALFIGRTTKRALQYNEALTWDDV